MHQIIDNILVIKNKGFTCFFDPESLIIFTKKDSGSEDAAVVAKYNEKRKSFPKREKRQFAKTHQDFSGICLELHVTDDCNLRCKYCYLESECEKEKKLEMSEEVIEAAYRFTLANFPKIKRVHISIYGGEPLLFWKKFQFLVEKAKEIFKGIKITMGFPTNGTIISEEILDFLKKNKIGFHLSWDGLEKEQDLLRPMANGKGTSEIINKNLPRFKEINKALGVRTTVTPYNMNLSEMFWFFKEKGFKKINFCACSSCHNDLVIKDDDLPKLFQEWDLLADLYLDHLSKEESPILIHPLFTLFTALHFGEKKSHFCGSGKSLFAVSASGEIYSCHRFVDNEKYKIGTLERGFFEESSLKQALFQRNVEEEKECKDCFAKYLCGGGCFHERSQAFFGTFCKIYTHLLAHAIRIYVQLQENHPKAFEKLIQQIEKQKNVEPSTI